MTANLVWSVALAGVGIIGLWLAGSQQRAGWAVGLGAQLLWLTFGIVSGQYGFILSAVAYGFVYARNFRRGRAPERVVTVRLHVDVKQYAESLRRIASRIERTDP